MVGLIDRLRTNQRALTLGSLYIVPKGNLMESWKETANNKFKLDNFWKENLT